MELCVEGAYAELLQYIERVKHSNPRHQVLYFPFSLLTEQFRSDYQIKIAINIVTDTLSGEPCKLFLLDSSDIVILVENHDKILPEKTIFQLRYLFMDDPLAYNDEGYEHKGFCYHYDIATQWDEFCHAILTYIDRKDPISAQDMAAGAPSIKSDTTIEHPTAASHLRKQLLSPENLHRAIEDITACDIEPCLRFQPICLFDETHNIFRPLFKEIYISIAHLERLLAHPVNLFSHPALFHYITETLDTCLLDFLSRNSNTSYRHKAFSINMNCRSLTTGGFAAFDAGISQEMKKNIIIETHLNDIFFDPSSYDASRELLRSKGYRLCLDGISTALLPRTRTSAIQSDFIKITWPGDVDNTSVEALTFAIEEHDLNRIILCRCDNEDAVAFGLAAGISIFQGRYIDSILDPDATYVN